MGFQLGQPTAARAVPSASPFSPVPAPARRSAALPRASAATAWPKSPPRPTASPATTPSPRPWSGQSGSDTLQPHCANLGRVLFASRPSPAADKRPSSARRLRSSSRSPSPTRRSATRQRRTGQLRCFRPKSASGVFTGGADTVTVLTDSNGLALAPGLHRRNVYSSTHWLVTWPRPAKPRPRRSMKPTSPPRPATPCLSPWAATVKARRWAPPLASCFGEVGRRSQHAFIRSAQETRTFPGFPASSVSGTFTGGAESVTVTTNSNGIATAPVFTADNTQVLSVTASLRHRPVTAEQTAPGTGNPANLTIPNGDHQATQSKISVLSASFS